jgi:hypothetical protein
MVFVVVVKHVAGQKVVTSAFARYLNVVVKILITFNHCKCNRKASVYGPDFQINSYVA